MSQQQPNSDPMTNSNQCSWSGENALVVARARPDVCARAALIIRARALLKEAMTAPTTPVHPWLIAIARSRVAERMATTSIVIMTPPPSP